jgi:hypothetical protein
MAIKENHALKAIVEIINEISSSNILQMQSIYIKAREINTILVCVEISKAESKKMSVICIAFIIKLLG